eukprot:TRINITY_DN2228_c2_g1_i1.p1 TRINITY_DN2228_c2_g1~~TRINITY_DN2228_c2_g1_i1.p1  ORF type:complete len:229 (-),score=49.21 TRINITY_DN2228_c2_g1_i1:44-730(-)
MGEDNQAVSSMERGEWCFLNLETREWEKHVVETESGSTALTHRRGHAITEFEGSLYIFGGYVESNTSDLWKLERTGLKEWRVRELPGTGGQSPTRRNHAGFHGYIDPVTKKRMLLVVGGGWPPINCNLYRYNLDDEKWIFTPGTKGFAPKPLSGHATVLVGDMLFLHGGCNSWNGCENIIHVLDIRRNMWSRVDTMAGSSPHRRFHSGALVGNQDHAKIFFFGGQNKE